MSSQHSEPTAQETRDGTVTRVLFRGDDGRFAVGVFEPDGGNESIRIAGELGQVQEGDHVRLVGQIRHDQRFGRQFKVSSAYPILPHTEAGLIGYLSSGRIQSIGPKLAARIVAHLGTETLEVILNQPERLAEVEGIGPKRRLEIAEQVRDQVFHRDAIIFLQGLGISNALSGRIWRKYEVKTIPWIKENPYRLAEEVSGIGFRTADQIAQALGFQQDSAARAAAAIVHVLGRAMDDGHIFLPAEILTDQVIKLVGDEAPVHDELMLLIDEGRLIDDGGVYLRVAHEQEQEIAERLLALVKPNDTFKEPDIDRVEARLGFRLADAQKEAVITAASSSVMVLTGGPGTGKTTTVQAILKVFRHQGERVLLTAPTGRAAKRLSETSGATASTIHRLLGYHPVDGFRHHEEEPLDATVVIIDEASMLDQPLCLALLRALPEGGRLVLVGDADQLPSVGPGNILADILESTVIPSVRLDVVFRQAKASDIVTNAYRILNGEIPETPEELEGCDFFVIPADTPQRAAELIETLVSERIPGRFEFDAVEDIQVLTPMHRGQCGAQQLNERLQACLNPDGASIGQSGRQFRVGDKVMQVRNDYQKEVFNGDLGRIIGRTESGVAIRFDKRIIDYDRASLDNIVLAYACSVHKSQGSEYPAVVIPVLTEHWVMLQRNLVYTAVTRGRRLVILVAQPKALRRAATNLEGIQRFTHLDRYLRQAR